MAQAVPKSALPAWRAWPLTGRIATVRPLGQVTLASWRLMSKRSLVNFPVGATGGWTLVLMSMPAVSSVWANPTRPAPSQPPTPAA